MIIPLYVPAFRASIRELSCQQLGMGTDWPGFIEVWVFRW